MAKVTPTGDHEGVIESSAMPVSIALPENSTVVVPGSTLPVVVNTAAVPTRENSMSTASLGASLSMRGASFKGV